MARFFLVFAVVIATVQFSAAAPIFDLLHLRDYTNTSAVSFNATQNALDAQALNFVFGSLTMNSTCNDKQLACVGSNVMICQDDAWEIANQCDGQLKLHCLALPELEGNGTVVGCASPSFAESVFKSAGVSGVNATSVSNVSSIVLPTIEDDDTEESCDEEPTVTVMTVTTTIFAGSQATATSQADETTTITVRSAELPGIISSALANGFRVTTLSAMPTASILPTSAATVSTN